MFNNEWDLTNVIDISKTKLAESILRLRKTDNLEKFLYPKLSDLNDPYLLKDMDKAVERIIEAIENQELILIYGDYDTDGITATAICTDSLKITVHMLTITFRKEKKVMD
jgi:single-stranded DNA-specific DHH superfamily exonuclease